MGMALHFKDDKELIDALTYTNNALRYDVEDSRAEITRLRRALDLLGVPAQATKDPDKAPPLRIDVRMAREVMEVVDGKDD